MRRIAILVVVASCWILAGADAAPAKKRSAPKTAPPPAVQRVPDADSPKTAPAAGPEGKLEINVTDVLGHDLHARAELQREGLSTPIVIEVPKGHAQATAPVGAYKAFIYVYSLEVPVLVDAQDVTVQDGKPAFVLVNLLEGSAGNRRLLDFDQDHDFAIDRVEVKCGTDPNDAASTPNRKPVPFDARVLVKKEGWYRGELHAHSSYGIGKESVAELVRRAERDHLDFLAITDRNTAAACADPAFKSDSVALLSALEWGSDERGVALLYGARTFPAFVDSVSQAQALVDLIQAQGGFFAIAYPCFPTAPWRWELGYVNGVEVWCRDWRSVPPMSLDQLSEDLKERIDGKLVHSIAYAAASTDFSANGQAALFYDAELVRGAKMAVIAGSNTASPEVPMAAPVTYVYAVEKSSQGILDGLRRGRTYVSSGLKGPKLGFCVDVLKDNTVDVSIGGIIPLGVPSRFIATVENAKGEEVQILLNGRPLISKVAESDAFTLNFDHTPENYAVYRLRVSGKAKPTEGFGPSDVLAMTSPIYAQDLDLPNPKIQEVKKEKDAQKDTSAKERPLPSTPGPGEIRPKWKF